MKKYGSSKQISFSRCSFILLIVILFSSCEFSLNDPNDKLKAEEIKKLMLSEGKNTGTSSTILVLSDNGCRACNKSFYNYVIENVINKNEVLIYSMSDSARLKYPILYADSINNYIEGTQELLKIIDLPDQPLFISIKCNKVDTILKFKEADMTASFQYITKVVNTTKICFDLN